MAATGLLGARPGCGDGKNAAWLAGRGFEVHGIDFSETAIRRAQEAYRDVPGLTFAAVDVSDRDSLGDRTFGALVDRECLHCVPEQLRRPYSRNVTAWAQPGAPFLLTMIGDVADSREHLVESLLGGAFVLEGIARVEGLVKGPSRTIDGTALRLRRRA